MRTRSFAAAAVLPALLLGGTAHAVRSPDIVDERSLETAAGAPGRAHVKVSWDAAPAWVDATPWRAFVAENGQWRSLWDAQTGVPQRLWGAGIDAPGASKHADVAERAARELLARHVALLAPGASASDFELVSNVVHGDSTLRTVGFVQRHGGLRVVGGQLSFLFKADRAIVIGSEALPNVSTRTAATALALVAAPAKAAAWIADLYDGAQPQVGPAGETMILPVVRDASRGARGIEYRVVRAVPVRTAAPVADWDVYVDAATGAPVARVQKIRHGEGTVRYKVPTRYPGSPREDAPAAFANMTAAGAAAATDGTGKITWAGNAAADVRTAVTGRFVALRPQTGSPASTTLNLSPGGSVVWDQSTNAPNDAQLSSFVFTNRVKQYAITRFANTASTLAWLNTALSVTVNEAGACNAYYDPQGGGIHFYSAGTSPSGTPCENTGRIADVVYHEFGHALHHKAIIAGAGSFDGAMSEGVSDYLAATITNDHGMGRGFTPPGSNNPLRDLNPARDLRYPDDLEGEVHVDGEIIAGTLWDLRAAMIGQYGADVGVRKADNLFYAIIQRASAMPTSFVEALAANDDDGNLANGTPDMCLIHEVFDRHGLAVVMPAMAGVGTPVRDGFHVTVPVRPAGGGGGSCSIATVGSMSVDWKLRGAGATTRVNLTRQGDTFVGTIPTQADTSVVQFKVTVALTSGGSFAFPSNAADPLYEFYVGAVAPLYCTDFEANPVGWTSGVVSGANEWSWGTPTGAGGDPIAAASGTRVYGLDLGGGSNDGLYPTGAESFVTTPDIDTRGYRTIRLQYKRWLGVEDGFFDKATIQADGTQVWTNLNSNRGDNSNTHHRDLEWRFQDLDITTQASDGRVRLRFGLRSDGGLEFGGWTMDDVCVVGVGPIDQPPPPDAGVPDAGVPTDATVPPADAGVPDATVPTPDATVPTPDAGETTPDAGETAPDASTPGTPDARVPTPPDAGETDPGEPDDGCCSTGRNGASSTALLGLAVGLALLRRRRRR